MLDKVIAHIKALASEPNIIGLLLVGIAAGLYLAGQKDAAQPIAGAGLLSIQTQGKSKDS